MKKLTIEDLKRNHDRMYQHGKITREKSADDTVFYHVTQWDDNNLETSDLGFKGEFNILRKSGRQIIGDLKTNQVQVEFQPVAETDDSGADFMDGLYRTSTRDNSTIESFDNAKQESVVCGVGGWEIYTEYNTNSVGDENQVIKRRPIHEFNSNAYWDESAVLLDKSDANRCSILVPLSKRGMEDLAEELTGVSMNSDTSSFSWPEHSYTFPWASGQDEIFYAVRYYERELGKDHVLTLTDPLGQELRVLESAISEIEDELLEDGYKIVETKEIKRWKVKLHIANGNRILKSYDIVGENIPVCVNYGERAFIEGEEYYEGVTRLAKDPQRLRNFQMSYLADIVSRSPRPKPIFNPEQILGFESMYEQTGSDNNLPYLLMHSKDPQGNPLPVGPVSQLPEQNVPNALMQSIALSREAVSDVAPANLSQDLSDIDLSGKALANLQNRLDEQSIVYQQNFKHALRRDAEIFASMASRVYDAPRSVMLTTEDGTRKFENIMESVLDEETGEVVVLNDLTAMEFNVFADIGPNYSTKREETFEKLGEMSMSAAQLDPQLSRMLLLKQAQLIDGVSMKDVRAWSRKQSILAGYVEPETEEEMQMMQQQSESQQPDANMVLAQAEQAKAQASMADVQRKSQLDQFNAQTSAAKVQVQQFDSETKRMAVQVDAQETDANINFKRIDTLTKRMDTINKQSLRGSARQMIN